MSGKMNGREKSDLGCSAVKLDGSLGDGIERWYDGREV